MNIGTLEIPMNPSNPADILGAYGLLLIDRLSPVPNILRSKFKWTGRQRMLLCLEGNVEALTRFLQTVRITATDSRMGIEASGSEFDLGYLRAIGSNEHGNLDLSQQEGPKDLKQRYPGWSGVMAGARWRAEECFKVFREQVKKGDLVSLFSKPHSLPTDSKGKPLRSALIGYNRLGAENEALYASDFLSLVALSLLRHSATIRPIEDEPRPSKAKTGETLTVRLRLWTEWAPYSVALSLMAGKMPPVPDNEMVEISIEECNKNCWGFTGA